MGSDLLQGLDCPHEEVISQGSFLSQKLRGLAGFGGGCARSSGREYAFRLSERWSCLTGTLVVLTISSYKNVSTFLVGIRLGGGEREHEVGLPEWGHLLSLTVSG